MLKGNLSTRPFYNERLVNVLIGAIALVVLLLTAFNASQIVELTGRRRAAAERIDSSRVEVARIAAETAALQRGGQPATLRDLAAATREANRLIEERTFSWSALFALLEKTMPMDVRLVSVTPDVNQQTLDVSLRVVARQLDDVDTFMDALQGTGAFYDVAPMEQQLLDNGTFAALIRASYLTPGSEAASAVKTGGRP
jgi:Tfp pilus assembly protein PilN